MITKKDYLILVNHTYADINYKEQGTFNQLNKRGENVFDSKEAERAKKVLTKLLYIVLKDG